jgi:hypothetical protein
MTPASSLRHFAPADAGTIPPAIPYSLFPIPYSLFPIPYSLFPIPYSLFPIPYSLFPIPQPRRRSHAIGSTAPPPGSRIWNSTCDPSGVVSPPTVPIVCPLVICAPGRT